MTWRGACGTMVLACIKAAANGHIEAVKFLHARGSPLTANCSTAAAKGGGGHLKVLKYLRRQQCPWSGSCYRAAAAGGRMKVLRYLYRHGCPWNEDDMWACRPGRGEEPRQEGARIRIHAYQRGTLRALRPFFSSRSPFGARLSCRGGKGHRVHARLFCKKKVVPIYLMLHFFCMRTDVCSFAVLEERQKEDAKEERVYTTGTRLRCRLCGCQHRLSPYARRLDSTGIDRL
jgi:hypothetical protein